jgi:hypothetical protein
LDKKLVRHAPDAATLSNVLMIFPAQSFVEKIPGEKFPIVMIYLPIPMILKQELKIGAKQWNFPPPFPMLLRMRHGIP